MRAFLFAGLALASVLVAFVASEGISNRPGHLNRMRRIVGHFKDQPFIDLYKTYAGTFLKEKYPDRAHDDDRMFTPSLDECIQFFTKFRHNKYKLNHIEEFPVLDGCLGYLYESEHHEEDKQKSKLGAQYLQPLIDDPQLSSLFQGTEIETIPDTGKHCVANLLMSSILMRHQFSEVQCNNHWIQLFLQFAGCHKNIPQELRESDSYIQILYQSVREETHKCFNAEIHFLNQAVRRHYKKSIAIRFMNRISGKFSSLHKEQGQRMWPENIFNLLATVQDAQSEVSVREVHKLLRGFYNNDAALTKKFLSNIAKHALIDIKPKSNDKGGDPEGHERYRKWVNNLCNYFRSSDSESRYDYATSFVRIVQLLEHKDVFDLAAETFMKSILTEANETAPLYLSISACNILAFTDGFVELPASNGKPGFIVETKPDITKMVRWPDAGFY